MFEGKTKAAERVKKVKQIFGGRGGTKAAAPAQAGAAAQKFGLGDTIGGAAALVKDTSLETFMIDVIDASMEVPVIVDFWAPWCGPCKQLGPILERVVRAANGAVRMVKLNIDEAPEIAQQLRIQSIPAVFAFVDGRPVDGFVGVQPESQIKSFVQQLAKLKKGGAPSAVEEALEHARAAQAAGDHGTAEALFRQILQREPTNIPALVGLARGALEAGDLNDATQIAARIPAESKEAEVASLRTAIALAEESREAVAGLRGLEARIAKDSNDHAARIDYAKAIFALGRRQEAVDALLAAFKADREWNDQAARKQLLKMFEAMGAADPITVAGRKRLSTILFS